MRVLLYTFGLLLVIASAVQCRSTRNKDIQRNDPSPYHVHISVYDRYMFKWPASGVLITEAHVLTAAVNVFNYYRWDLGFGSELFNDLHTVSSYYAILHEKFNDTTDDNNVAMVVMPEPIKLTSQIQAIALPAQGDLMPAEGDIGLISAFAKTTAKGPITAKLNHGIQSVLSERRCVELYPHLHGIANHYFCASDNNFNVCGGAQGAGLVLRRADQTVLAGILSFGSIWDDCASKTPAGFIRISEYVDWITQKIALKSEYVFAEKPKDSAVLGISY